MESRPLQDPAIVERGPALPRERFARGVQLIASDGLVFEGPGSVPDARTLRLAAAAVDLRADSGAAVSEAAARHRYPAKRVAGTEVAQVTGAGEAFGSYRRLLESHSVTVFRNYQ